MNISLIFILTGFFTFLISTLFSHFKVQPVHTFYFIFAWWSYIIVLDGVIYSVKKNSLIISRTREFLLMLPLSAACWFLFEIMNLRLENWQYVLLPLDRDFRYAGYLLAYATVFPALFETAELLGIFNLFGKLRLKPLALSEKRITLLPVWGLASLALALLFPKYFFPLVWGCFILLLDPVNYRLGLTSLIKEAKGGNWQKIFILMSAGLLCGLLWELWNFNAGAKWIYTLPWAGGWKLFEMPATGYLGFPFFALECYIIYNFFSWLRKGVTWEEFSQTPLTLLKTPKYGSAYIYILFIIIIPLICLFGMKLIDAHTVKLFALI